MVSASDRRLRWRWHRARRNRVNHLAIQAVALPDPAERADLLAHYAPAIEIEADGGHWYRTWLMLRDSQVYWPWYDRRLAALRRVEADFSARPLHRWTMDVMRARASYAEVIHAALHHDAAAALRELVVPIIHVTDPATPLSAYDTRVRAARADVTSMAGNGADFVDQLDRVVTEV